MSRRTAVEFLRAFGVRDDYKGFDACCISVELALHEPERLAHVTKWIYPDVAKRCGTSIVNVERNIRTIAEKIWKNGGVVCLGGQPEDERPANAAFLRMLTYWVNPELNPVAATAQEEYTAAEFLRKRIKELERENMQMKMTVEWMHEMIWEMVKKQKEGGAERAEENTGK